MDLIERQAAIDAIHCDITVTGRQNAELVAKTIGTFADRIKALPSAQPDRLDDDDFETIRIHLSACKEKLCNQHRWKEAEEYQRIIDRFMAFASAQPERKKGKWIDLQCNQCGQVDMSKPNFCPNCGAEMNGRE